MQRLLRCRVLRKNTEESSEVARLHFRVFGIAESTLFPEFVASAAYPTKIGKLYLGLILQRKQRIQRVQRVQRKQHTQRLLRLLSHLLSFAFSASIFSLRLGDLCF